MVKLPGVFKHGRQLAPVQRRWYWIIGGLALQIVGVGILVAVVLERASKDGLLGHLTGYTVRLVWHEALRSHPDVALLVLGAVIFVGGCVVMARPFVEYSATLFVAVPIAAVAGVLILGVAALILFLAVATADAIWSDGGSIGSGSGGLRSVRRRQDPTQFESTVVACASRDAARAEAARRQDGDTSDATWIYIQIDGQWVAKRTPTDIEV